MPFNEATSSGSAGMDPRITLSALRQLAELSAQGSIGAVARHLGLSQPTVSSTLMRLERVVGVPLLVRTTRGAHLTSEGIRLVDAARGLLNAADELAAVISALPAQTSGPLRIAASLTVADHLVPRWLARFGRAAGIDAGGLNLSVDNSRGVMDLVMQERVDFGFVEGERFHPSLMHVPVAHDELVVVVGPSHAWFGGATTITPSKLLHGGLILREPGSGTLQVLEGALARLHLDLPGNLPRFGSTSAILTAVRHGGSVGVVSRLAVEGELEHGSLSTVQVEGMRMVRVLSVVWRADRPQRAQSARLISALVASFGRERRSNDG